MLSLHVARRSPRLSLDIVDDGAEACAFHRSCHGVTAWQATPAYVFRWRQYFFIFARVRDVMRAA